MIKVGDWVTQYSAGYWKVIDIIPKYADEDYNYNGKSWKKGDRLGDWVILKKGFTPKMKPSNRCEFVDSSWCEKVPSDISDKIESTFLENPKIQSKFLNAQSLPEPSVTSIWLNLSDEKADEFTQLLNKLPNRFTVSEMWENAGTFRHFETRPPATHILYLFSYLWEIDANFDTLYFNPTIKKLDED